MFIKGSAQGRVVGGRGVEAPEEVFVIVYHSNEIYLFSIRPTTPTPSTTLPLFFFVD
jgi:hypothetical protein